MRTTRKRIVVFILLSLCSCSKRTQGPKSNLVGTWKESGQVQRIWEIREDGTIFATTVNSPYEPGPGKYKYISNPTSGHNFIVEWSREDSGKPPEVFQYDVVVQGDELLIDGPYDAEGKRLNQMQMRRVGD